MSNIGGALPPQSEYWGGGGTPPAHPAPTPLVVSELQAIKTAKFTECGRGLSNDVNGGYTGG